MMKKKFSILALSLALVFLFSSVVSAAGIDRIYYSNEAGEIIEANYLNSRRT